MVYFVNVESVDRIIFSISRDLTWNGKTAARPGNAFEVDAWPWNALSAGF